MDSEGVLIPLIHEHLVMPWNNLRRGDCCGRFEAISDGYYCKTCDFFFHKKCAHESSEYIEHPSHPNHTLQLLSLSTIGRSNRCDLCGRFIADPVFYRCEICDFDVDRYCAKYPPPEVIDISETHHHKLILLKEKIEFNCDAKCGEIGDGFPYKCLECDLSFHVDCVWHPPEVNHPLEVNHSYHPWHPLKLHTGQPPDYSDGTCRLCANDNTIQHFSHKEHYLRLHVNGVLCDDNKRCKACTYPICLQSFYGCLDCDFILHQNCAGFLRMKWHVLHNERLTLVTNKAEVFECYACSRISNGFRYQHEDTTFDVQCGSVSEPFFHPSHPNHPLYNISLIGEFEICNGCKKHRYDVLRCIEDDCNFFLCFKCATLPQVVKHRVDNHPLSLCYGEKASAGVSCVAFFLSS
ncbi:unnamed protein product [Arabidopsis arenosa]|uniref:Phorbol-ester/DAG-type domain-containing protein n=1 Tax=Arabidopsis arenosa TaxID=38785 RepID=A0A8S2ALT4_ARAAE|nr:unnamed protein product [Arabidopsis arenosa]